MTAGESPNDPKSCSNGLPLLSNARGGGGAGGPFGGGGTRIHDGLAGVPVEEAGAASDSISQVAQSSDSVTDVPSVFQAVRNLSCSSNVLFAHAEGIL